MKTSQAGFAEGCVKPSQTSQVSPKSLDVVASVIFWWDNLDRNFETLSSNDSIRNTLGVK